MPSKKSLLCPTKHRMQRLLWSPEYESFMNLGTDEEPIVLVESPFVVETKHDGVDKMVYMCLTTESLLISEEELKAQDRRRETMDYYEVPEMTTACRRTEDEEDGDWDLQDFRLKYLFPLQHVRLSVRQYREKEGEHVLRLRLGEAEETEHMKTWYLELAGRHRELMWEWWKDWIEELEERRKEQRHRLKVFKKKIAPQHNQTNLENIDFGELNLDWRRNNHGLVLSQAPSNKSLIKQDSNSGQDIEDGPLSKIIKREALREWHIEEHKKRVAEKHPDHARRVDSTGGILTDEITEADIISRCTQYGVPIPTTIPCSPSFYGRIGLPVPESLLETVIDSGRIANDEINSCSSLEDILSVGSLVDSDVDWHHAVSTQINDRLVLCVGDLFEKSNVEIHEHGHMARVRPMASDTALVHLLEFEETNLAIDDKHHVFVGIDKEVLHHTNSIPDILEGEAAFLEDDYEASQVTHQRSWVTLDLANENNHLQSHIINGHVLLVTKKQLRLEKELIKFRGESHDIDFTTCKHKGKAQRYRPGKQKKREAGMVQKFKDAKKKKKRNAKDHHGNNFTAKLKHKLHIGDHSSHKHVHLDGQKAVDFLKHNILHVDELPPWAVGLPEVFTITSDEVHPEALARELTLIDKTFFLLIHESELVGCMWMKHDKHSKAPNVMKLIEFFERVVRAVSAEIVKRNYDWARAKAMAYFTKVAATCLELQNFHSLKAILCGMQVPSIYRLKHSWSDFKEQYPDEYRSYCEMAHLMADEGCSVDYFNRLEQAEKNPPYLPFIGAFLKNWINVFTVLDEGGMRREHKQKTQNANIDEPAPAPGTSHQCAHGGLCNHSESESDDIAECDEVDEPFADLFQKVSKKTKKDDKDVDIWYTKPTHTGGVEKSPAYLMNERLFHIQIAAIQYKWIDLPQVREFWLRNKVADEVEMWNMSCQKEDVTKPREEKEIRMARKARIEDEFQKRQERFELREKLAREAAFKTDNLSKSGMSFANMSKKMMMKSKKNLKR